MQYTYSTFIEMVSGKDFRIVGVANNPLSRNNIPINIFLTNFSFNSISKNSIIFYVKNFNIPLTFSSFLTL
jgi:hypothetical protein